MTVRVVIDACRTGIVEPTVTFWVDDDGPSPGWWCTSSDDPQRRHVAPETPIALVAGLVSVDEPGDERFAMPEPIAFDDLPDRVGEARSIVVVTIEGPEPATSRRLTLLRGSVGAVLLGTDVGVDQVSANASVVVPAVYVHVVAVALFGVGWIDALRLG